MTQEVTALPTSVTPVVDPSRSPVRVLVVDDHALLRATIRLLLDEAPDMEWVGEAEDGEAGVNLVARLRPDAVLMDLSMPGTDGLSATRQIAAAFADTRVIVITSSVDTVHLGVAIASGASAVLSKDGNPETILAGIREVMQRGEARSARG
jgi:DNA-binding NarL/FixJ family response regulator